jgi:hypothetical protein
MKIILIIIGMIAVWWLYQATWLWLMDQIAILRAASSMKYKRHLDQ